MKRNELESLIREVVKDELQKTTKLWLKTYVPAVVGQVVTELVETKVQKLLTESSNKRKKINENVSITDEDWPLLHNKTLTTKDAGSLNREKMISLLGYGDVKPSVPPMTIITDAGVEIPVPEEKIPEDVKDALTKNYSGFLKKMNSVTARTRSG